MLAKDCSCKCHLPEDESKYRGWCGTCKFLHPPTNLSGPNNIVPTVDDIWGDWKLERVQNYLFKLSFDSKWFDAEAQNNFKAGSKIIAIRAKYFPHVQVWAKGL